ncbi:hypothetical protein [Pelosinus sp. IPA-1]|uniref:hypothetical protein n=1 Tax=Pelosinus sp. IPA-1 TaxID=3029569 RepID=UPI0024362753|nr:hypothetical protein [Pelosinus sp. IPA-1]GMA97968.1 hypothetical protein PIPA1_07680 [Pelosinus sp. IPA-1]
MENIDATITFDTLKEIGFVPSILIVGGWLCACVLALICLYNLGLYAIRLLLYRKTNNGR